MSESLKKIAKGSLRTGFCLLAGWGIAMGITYQMAKSEINHYEKNYGVESTVNHCESFLSNYDYMGDILKYGVYYSSKFAYKNYVDENKKKDFSESFDGGLFKWE